MSETVVSKSTSQPRFQRLKKMLMLLASLICLSAFCVFFYLKQPQFVQLPENIQFNQVAQSSEYQNGTFENQVPTPVMTRSSDKSQVASVFEFLFSKTENAVPAQPLPSMKTDLLHLNRHENAIVWMGHSTYFLQIDGKRFLIDPVFSENASPVPATNVAFKGSNIYTAADIPEIDYLLISHDHWDHLDYPTVMALKDKVNNIVTPLGVGSYFRQWGFDAKKIHEGDWNSQINGDNGLEIHILPARHFSGRLLTRNKTLWGSFALITPHQRVYLGGDSGYGPHFKVIGQKFGPFDIAILECGQYNQDWRYIHMMPEETAQAAADLNAKALLPAHNSKFKLSRHAWYDPLDRVSKASEGKAYRLLTPMIGEKIESDNPNQSFKSWWKNLEPTTTH